MSQPHPQEDPTGHGAAFLFDDETFADQQELPLNPFTRVEQQYADNTAELGVAVPLEARAIAAHAIMGYFNAEARLKGLQKSRSTPDNRFDTRYNSVSKHAADAKYKSMEEAAATKQDIYYEQLQTLVRPDALNAIGFSDDEVYRVSREVQRETQNYAYGASNGYERKKLLKKFDATAQRVEYPSDLKK